MMYRLSAHKDKVLHYPTQNKFIKRDDQKMTTANNTLNFGAEAPRSIHEEDEMTLTFQQRKNDTVDNQIIFNENVLNIPFESFATPCRSEVQIFKPPPSSRKIHLVNREERKRVKIEKRPLCPINESHYQVTEKNQSIFIPLILSNRKKSTRVAQKQSTHLRPRKQPLFSRNKLHYQRTKKNQNILIPLMLSNGYNSTRVARKKYIHLRPRRRTFNLPSTRALSSFSFEGSPEIRNSMADVIKVGKSNSDMFHEASLFESLSISVSE